MKSVLISIQPYYVFLIIARLMGWNIPQEKTVEVRKDFPKDLSWNKRVLIYCSKNRESFNRIPAQYQPFMEKLLGKVVGNFECDRIEQIVPDYNPKFQKFFYGYVTDLSPTCLGEEELHKYAGIEPLYFWRISDLKIYDTPKELGEFWKIDKCPYVSDNGCTYNFHCFRAAENSHKYGRCGERLTRPPQSWFYVEA